MSFKHESLPFEYEWLDEVSDDGTQYYNSQFVEDFGVFKKGDKADYLLMRFRDWELRQINVEGEILKKQDYWIIPYKFPHKLPEPALKSLTFLQMALADPDGVNQLLQAGCDIKALKKNLNEVLGE